MAVQLRSINRKPVDGFNGSENSGCRRFRSYRSRGCKAVSGSWLQGNSNANTFRIGFGGRRKGFRFFQSQKPDLVVLAAGKVGGILENKSKPIEFLTRNLAIQMNVCAAADLIGTSRVVLFGSSCMYPKECPQPMSEDMLGTGKLEPTSLSYATAKIAGLQLGFSYNQQHGIDRFCVLYQTAPMALVIISIHSLAMCWPHWYTNCTWLKRAR